MSKKRALIVGFGRMGLSHAALMSGLLGPDNVEFSVSDPGFFSRLVARSLIKDLRFVRLKTLQRHRDLLHSFDYILLTAPPFLRSEFLELLADFRGRVFVEKPVFCHLSANQMSGYVLQHAPLNPVLRDRLRGLPISEVTARLVTNASFESIKSGWRSKSFGSVLHEFGGHVLSLVGASWPDDNIFRSHINDIQLEIARHSRDEVRFAFTEAAVRYSIELLANRQDVRKASYDIQVRTAHGDVHYDLYSIRSTIPGFDATSIPELGISVDFYLRGFEFTRQMTAFLDGTMDILSSEQIANMEQLLLAVERH
ncbi:MAG: hypothetical protein IT485_02865 [Gammaproteobacteria bacterium]|nr:hypothetical protein [Gammaproteobacteria bacterium]QOJ31992.1 MAG: hypothetical protein HRU81_07745 [Gammaproteobacteria bacterium]